MKTPLFLAVWVASAAALTAQTLYVPGGTSTGIGNNTTNGNVGIGTATPASKLTVVGNIKATTGDLQVDAAHGLIDVSAAASVMFDGNGKITATMQNSQPFVFTGGNVGIGTSTPTTQLAVRSINSTSLALSRAANPNIQFYDDATTYIGQIYYDANRIFHIGTAGGGDTLTLNSANGNIGIGNASPAELLDIRGGAPSLKVSSTQFDVPSSLKIFSTGTNTNARSTLWLENNDTVGGGGTVLIQGALSASSANVTHIPAANGGLNNTLQLFALNGNGMQLGVLNCARLTILNSGNVGIGTTAPTHKLAVNGTIRAKEVIVNTGWSDYVFADNYRLAPLSEVETHIKAERHLPGIPSAQEVAERGVSIGEMQSKLLAKIEELTLHQIAQEKEISALKKQNSDIGRQIAQLKSAHSSIP